MEIKPIKLDTKNIRKLALKEATKSIVDVIEKLLTKSLVGITISNLIT